MQIMANFTSSMIQYLDARQKWASLAVLQANEDTILMPNGFIVYCEEEAAWYILSTTDPKDTGTYVWNEFLPSVELDAEAQASAIAKLGVSSFAEAIATLAANDFITIEKLPRAENEAENLYAHVYQLKVKNAAAEGGYSYIGDPINIPKDMVVEDATLETVTEENIATLPEVGFEIGDRYIDLVIANANGKHIYINVKDLFQADTTKITYSYISNPEVPDSVVSVPLNEMLDTLRTFKDTTTLKVANLDAEGKISTDNVKYTEGDATEAVTNTILGLKGRLNTAEATIRNLASGKPVKPEFSVSPSKTTYLNAKGVELSNVSFTATAANISLVTGAISVQLYKGSDVVATQEITGESLTAVLNVEGVVSTDTAFKVVFSYKFDGDTDFRTEEFKYNYKFVDYSYNGILEPNATVVDSVASLNKTVKTTAEYTYNSITVKNKKVCYAYPAGLGEITNIKDGNGFDVTDAFETSTVEINSVSYTALVSKETMTLTNGKLIFS